MAAGSTTTDASTSRPLSSATAGSAGPSCTGATPPADLDQVIQDFHERGTPIRRLLATHEVAVTIEEAAIGGLGAHVLTLASDEGLVDAGLKIRTMRLPDRFQEHDKPEKQYDEAGLNAPHIVDTVLKALRRNSVGVENGARA